MLSTASAASLSQHSNFVPTIGTCPLEISLARSRSDLDGAFRLLYNSYLRAGLAVENPKQVRVTPFHTLPTTEVFVAKCRSDITSTLTMVVDGPKGLPMDEMYRVELDEIRGTGLRLAEIGCLADRRESPIRFVNVFRELARLVVQVARVRGINALVVATHPRHAGFYRRCLGFERFGNRKSCPYAKGNPAVALILEFSRIRGTSIHEWLFGDTFDAAMLQPTQWDAETVSHVADLVDDASRQLPLH